LNLNGTVNIGDCLLLALFSGRINANLVTPVVTSVSPSPVSTGGTLTIGGTGFAGNPADFRVLFTTSGGVVRVIPTSATATSLTLTVPNSAVSGPIQVYRVDAPMGGNEYPLFVTGTTTPLALTGVSPFFGVSRGSTVTLTGMGFSLTPSANTVLFRRAVGTTGATVVSASAISLSVTVPSDAVCGEVTVQVGNTVSDGRIVTISGTSCVVKLVDILGNASPGETISLEGAGFDVVSPQNNVVKFGTLSATVLQSGGTQLQVRVPDNAVAGPLTVTVGATTSAPLQYNPSSNMVPASIDVVVNSANPVGSYQVTISYDKNIVQLSSANVRGGTGAGFANPPGTINIDNAAGTVTFNAFQVGNAPTGTFTVANLVFIPVAPGTSSLTLSGVTVTDTSGNDLPVNRLTLSSNSITILGAQGNTSVIGQVLWGSTPLVNASVVIKQPGNYNTEPILAQTTTGANGAFTISNPPSGNLYIYAVAPDSTYWAWSGQSITITPNQQVNAGTLRLYKIMQLVSPPTGSTVSTSTPTLQWTAFAGATNYTVSVHNNTTGQLVHTQSTSNTSITTPALPPGSYQWSVNAFDSGGQGIAYYSAWHFIVN